MTERFKCSASGLAAVEEGRPSARSIKLVSVLYMSSRRSQFIREAFKIETKKKCDILHTFNWGWGGVFHPMLGMA